MAYYGLFTANMMQLLENKGIGLLWLIMAYSRLIMAYYGLFTANTMQLLENAIHH